MGIKTDNLSEKTKKLAFTKAISAHEALAIMSGSPLSKALEIVNGKRQEDYGPPEQHMKKVAKLWSAFLGFKVSSSNVCSMMILLKLAREHHKHNFDNILDTAGYTEIMHRCVQAEKMGGNENE